MNFSSVRSPACTSLGARPWTSVKVGPCVGPDSPAPASIWRLNPATVGVSKTARTPNSTSSAVFTAAINRIAEIESPPISKNESSAPTCAKPSTWA